MLPPRSADVFDHHRLRQRLPHGLGQDARERIKQAASGIGCDAGVIAC